jgi:hypothetical protein
MASPRARAVLGLVVLAAAGRAGAQRPAVLAATEEDPAALFAPEEGPPPDAAPPAPPPPPQPKEKVRRHRHWAVPRFVGGGYTYGKVSSSAPGIGTAEGRGWNLFLGWDLTTWLDLGFRAAATKTRVTWTPDPADTDSPAESGFAGPGLVARLLPGRLVDPWLGLDLAYHSVNWDEYLLSVGGWGWLGSAGLDLQLVRFGVIRLGVSYSSFTATTASGYGQTGPAPGPEDDGAKSPMETLWVTAAWLFDFGPPR